ncbi:PIN domain-containing protein [Frankia sp. CNm7]|uniref:Ribonuclease VapC n=1 Tax=Frankia nepalensis TaxID=1836974 RepID=A0A937UPI4_9ACTN|nr:PIN domain-containing protein [Frankia nepalensis]MBL7499229.1 PIN domain-containing protein [Frankia nepalensis]MBL7512125.1 PIN domain-containing protein [Frankia nepalensis]MBL7521026.1 PIN domain-containing protein [Frankia nepalensis]MBL7627300.1 PIN domain-containing protein [Frankia nepalensis]
MIVDTNVIVAAMNQRDKNHKQMTSLLEAHDNELVVTPYVVAETSYLITKRVGASAEIQFIDSVHRGAFRQADLTAADMSRIVELMRQFRTFPLGAADASVIAIAERLGERDIATIDGHFRAIRPHGLDYFNLLP